MKLGVVKYDPWSNTKRLLESFFNILLKLERFAISVPISTAVTHSTRFREVGS